MPVEPFERPGLMVMDMQNDFCGREGVFARHGFPVDSIERIVPRIRTLMELCKDLKIPIISTKLTILTDLSGNAMGLGHLRTLRPFLAEEGYRLDTWGHQIIDGIPSPDYEVRKWGYNAMYQTELEKVLQALELKTLIFTGIATNGVVEGTAREANMRGWEVVTVTDCVAAYVQKLHEASLLNLGNIGSLLDSQEAIARLRQTEKEAVGK